jgi:menaquinone-dependent protoporphyrinogen oxidase
MSVLVVVASRHGATRGIAEAIGCRLSEHGVDAIVANADEAEEVTGYDAVVIGSAVYMGKWQEAARGFVDEHVGALAVLPVWLFSSGPIGDPPKPSPEDAVDVRKIVALTGARDHRVFGGELVKNRLTFAERAVVGAFHAPEGDFRNWDEIAAWADGIAEAVQISRAREAAPRVPA